jgi:hypothetical protein
MRYLDILDSHVIVTYNVRANAQFWCIKAPTPLAE